MRLNGTEHKQGVGCLHRSKRVEIRNSPRFYSHELCSVTFNGYLAEPDRIAALNLPTGADEMKAHFRDLGRATQCAKNRAQNGQLFIRHGSEVNHVKATGFFFQIALAHLPRYFVILRITADWKLGRRGVRPKQAALPQPI